MLEGDLLQLLSCPVCGATMFEQDTSLCCNGCNATYPIVNNIPRFVKAEHSDPGQEQVKHAFGTKWARQPSWGIRGSTATIMDDWMLGVLGWESEAAYRSFLETKRVILDAGCGNGRETARIARLNPDALIVGLDISSAVDHAARNSAGLKNVRFIQGDLCAPPLTASSFDYILSFGVLHHTPSTREALFSLLRLLRPGGECAFYVYRKKAPLREFADDYVRARLQSMTTAEAWQEMEHLTMFSRALSDLNCMIEVPEDVPTLGIQAGRHNLQRLIYYTMFKCYWRDSFSFDDNVHVNFDWYYPRYAWRHTRSELAQWIAEANMHIVMAREIDAGYSFRITPARRSAG